MSPPLPDTVSNPNAIQAQARLHHAYLLGLQLMWSHRRKGSRSSATGCSSPFGGSHEIGNS